jgi:hypothetical protein
LFKEAGGGRTPWHQDQYYWPLDTEKTITMWMPLVDVSAEIGSMTFASGSQRHGYLGSYAISDESDAEFARMVDEKALPLDTHGALAAGDATFHNGWMLHSAPANPTGILRAVMTIIWYADGARVSEPQSPAQEFDRKLWLGGVEAGQPAEGKNNPRLWPNPLGALRDAGAGAGAPRGGEGGAEFDIGERVGGARSVGGDRECDAHHATLRVEQWRPGVSRT